MSIFSQRERGRVSEWAWKTHTHSHNYIHYATGAHTEYIVHAWKKKTSSA